MRQFIDLWRWRRKYFKNAIDFSFFNVFLFAASLFFFYTIMVISPRRAVLWLFSFILFAYSVNDDSGFLDYDQEEKKNILLLAIIIMGVEFFKEIVILYLFNETIITWLNCSFSTIFFFTDDLPAHISCVKEAGKIGWTRSGGRSIVK